MTPDSENLAVWVVTADGLALALRLMSALPEVTLHVSRNLPPCAVSCVPFRRLADCVAERFTLFKGHIFIMAAGIVVRVIAPHLTSKTHDPAVVVMDDGGRYAISLLSGHIGGGNQLAESVAQKLRAIPVITTSTDVHNAPAIDVIATDHNLVIENPGAIKIISMAFLNHMPVGLHDPYHLIDHLPELQGVIPVDISGKMPSGAAVPPMVAVDDHLMQAGPRCLKLRPATLIAGVGCNRNTPADEIQAFLTDRFQEAGLSLLSLKCIATIDIKSDESGLIEVAERLQVPLQFFTREELDAVESIPNPSEIVKKYIGVSSVCEAAAILASNRGKIIVPKQTSPNVTLAVARTAFISSD